MKLYKLTDKDGKTYGGCQWGEEVEHTAPGTGDLCTAGWIHAYTDPLLAVLLNPIHANFADARLWEAEGEIGKTDHGLKVGCTSLKTIREIALPVVTSEQRIRFAIACARQVFSHPDWDAWAAAWMSGKNRSGSAAEAAAEVAAEAAWAARAAARAAAARAVRAEAARAVRAEAARAAWGAVAVAVADEPVELDLVAIAQEACREA